MYYTFIMVYGFFSANVYMNLKLMHAANEQIKKNTHTKFINSNLKSDSEINSLRILLYRYTKCRMHFVSKYHGNQILFFFCFFRKHSDMLTTK